VPTGTHGARFTEVMAGTGELLLTKEKRLCALNEAIRGD